MNSKFKILFYEDGNPMDPRCIKRFLGSFPKRYVDVVTKIINDSMSLDKDIFISNTATLLPSFGMTRNWAFKGVGLKNRNPDPTGILRECWDKIGTDLKEIRKQIDEKTKSRSRALMELQDKDRDYIIKKTSDLFKILSCHVNARSGQIKRVGASKILFSAIPEIALPVDNSEWDKVFMTKDNYEQILSTMISEISEWEGKTKKIDELDPNKPTTLPSIYNIMAMYARPLH